jgi:caffeoyl-CoA O-methyltransferase
MEIVNKEIEQYSRDHTSEESEAVKALIQKSKQELRYIDMISGKIIGELLALLIHLSGAEKVLEIGTFVGYSALRMAEALPETGSIITCDYNERYEKIARSAFEQSDDGDKIAMKMGPAVETIKHLGQTFDLIFIDADKANYPYYYKNLITKLKTGGMMAIDNVFWSGKVLNPDDNKTRAIDRCNEMIMNDERVENVMLPVRDGLMIVRRIK